MRPAILATLMLAVSMPAALADPVENREAVMKERGQILRTLGPIAQGRAPFDAGTVMAALEALNTNAQAHDIEAFYPEDGRGGDAAETIWTDRDAFVALDAEHRADVAAALDAAPQDLETFQAAFGPVAANCGACHERFRN